MAAVSKGKPGALANFFPRRTGLYVRPPCAQNTAPRLDLGLVSAANRFSADFDKWSKGVLIVRVISILLAASIVPDAMLFAQNVAPQAQAPVSPSANVSRYSMAVVDIGYIFKEHKRFKMERDAMKRDVEAAESALREEAQKIQKLQERLEQLKPGTPDFKSLDEELAKQKADFNLRATKQKKEFLDREASIYYKTHLEVDEAVAQFAQRHNIGLVLRFNGDKPDPNIREDVLRAINRPVVYQNNIDITPDILQHLNRIPGVARQVPGPGRPAVPNRAPRQ
jgi:Skp family chaperone for outer membrane proteins